MSRPGSPTPFGSLLARVTAHAVAAAQGESARAYSPPLVVPATAAAVATASPDAAWGAAPYDARAFFAPVATVLAHPSDILEAEPNEAPHLIDTGPSPNGWHGHETELLCDQDAAFAEAGIRGERDPLVRGTLLHIGLAHRYARQWCVENGHDPDRYYLPEDAVRAKVDREIDPIFRKWGDKVCGALRAYDAKWRASDALYTVESVERVYTWPAGTLIRDATVPVETTEEERRALVAQGVPEAHALYRAIHIPARDYTMRIDLVFREKATAGVFVLDHKGTAAEANASTLRYTLSGQFLGLHATGRALWGSDYRGSYPNLVGFGWSGHTFARPPLLPAPGAHAAFQATVQAAHLRRELRRLRRLPLHGHTKLFNERTCGDGAYGPCDHYHRCRMGVT